MKALSLIQPWASLVAIGAKLYETRSWQTNYRGEIAIHASKNKEALNLCLQQPFVDVLFKRRTWDSAVPLGGIVAVVNVLGCAPAEQYDQPPYSDMLGIYERAFGDWSPGRYVWQLADIRLLPEPVPCRGALGIWNVVPDIEAQVRRLLEIG